MADTISPVSNLQTVQAINLGSALPLPAASVGSALLPSFVGGAERVGSVAQGAVIIDAFRVSASPVVVTNADFFLGMAGAGVRSANLPAASSAKKGQRFIIQEVGGDAGAISIQPNGADNINGNNGPVVIASAYGQRLFITDGASNWYASSVI